MNSALLSIASSPGSKGHFSVLSLVDFDPVAVIDPVAVDPPSTPSFLDFPQRAEMCLAKLLGNLPFVRSAKSREFNEDLSSGRLRLKKPDERILF